MTIVAELTDHDLQAFKADELMKKEDYTGAAAEAGKVLDQLEPTVPTIAHAALTKAKAMMYGAMLEMSQTGELPPRELFDRIWTTLKLSQNLDPENAETKKELGKLSRFLRQVPPRPLPRSSPAAAADLDVLIVGGGASGMGTSLMLTETFGVPKPRVLVVERGAEVGETFRLWPKEMRFISPSFNQQGWTKSYDLNAISHGTSVAYSLHTEHPSGADYAKYLVALAKASQMNVRTSTEVVAVRDIKKEGEEHPLFEVDLRGPAKEVDGVVAEPTTETLKARYIVWAAGEFQYPGIKTASEQSMKEQEEKKSDGDHDDEDITPKDTDHKSPIVGAHLCLHNSQVRSWADLPGDDFIVIGGYESGVDATYNIALAGKKCWLVASTACWNTKTTDPSAELAPYTAARLQDALSPRVSPHPRLLAPLRVLRVEREADGYCVVAEALEEEPTTTAAEAKTLRPAVDSQTPSEMKEEVGEQEEGSTLIRLHTPQPPILCTGFEGSVRASASHLFAFHDDVEEEEPEEEAKAKDDDDDGHHHHHHNHEHEHKGCLQGAPKLTKNDESTKVPGVFLVGPAVSHGQHSLCFIYKFRQRFGVVANAICQGLGRDTREAVAQCRKDDMYMDDFSCCGDTCGDVC